MKVDTARSQYRERDDARDNYTRRELRRLRYLMRRLQYLETKIEETGGMTAPGSNGGAAHAEWEVEALEFALTELEFLETR